MKSTIQNRVAKIDVEPNATSLIIKELKGSMLNMKKTKNNNKVALEMRWKSLSKEFKDIVKEFQTACPRSQAGTTAAIYRRECHSGRALTLRIVMLSVRSLFRSTERVHDRLNYRDVYVSGPWRTASDVILSLLSLPLCLCNSRLQQSAHFVA